MLLVHHADHFFPLDFECAAWGYCGGCGESQPRHCRERFFSQKIAWDEECDGGFLAGIGDDRDLRAALLKIEDRVRWLSLRKERILGRQLDDSSSQSCAH